MATILQDNQQLKRIVKVHDIGGVEVTISTSGIAFRVPGTKVGTTLSWSQAVAKSETPGNVKSYHMGRPTEFLQSQVKKVSETRAAKEEKG